MSRDKLDSLFRISEEVLKLKTMIQQWQLTIGTVRRREWDLAAIRPSKTEKQAQGEQLSGSESKAINIKSRQSSVFSRFYLTVHVRFRIK